jgi:hypothetical protein
MMYKLQKDGYGQDYVLIEYENGTKVIPFNTESPDYQAYLKWLAEGNTPLPADAP